MQHKSNIIPELQIRTGNTNELDLQSICIFMALGYFLGERTYYKGLKQHIPASVTETDDQGNVISSKPYFKWHYSPRDISFQQAVDEFTHLFETIIAEKGEEGYTIPISGGLDSRTLLAACQSLGKSYKGYSYAFDGGHDETIYGKKMSDLLGFDFDTYKVKEGQLWTYVDRLAARNECYSEFTHARQYAFHDILSSKGGTFLLGHGGDLYFDDMGVPSNLKDDEIMKVLWSRIVKKSGFELATNMWEHWGMQGDFREFLESELKKCLAGIDIPDANAKLRAFKSLYYVPRWTCVNLQIFQDFGPVVIPYFDDRICQFICTVPERLLKGRKIQIEYLKRRQPGLARIPWQSHYPYNLYTYKLDRVPFNLPYRMVKKISRMVKGETPVTRNWELQFKGERNEQQLITALTGDKRFLEFIPEQTVRHHLDNFLNKDSLAYYPSVTMLLTLSKFIRLMHEGKNLS
jgi:Asparagine synthase